MALSSFKFLLFIAAVITVYYVVPKRIQWIVLLVASYVFYLSGGAQDVVYIIATTLFTYGSGLWMQKIRSRSQEQIAALGPDATKDQKRELKKAASAKIHTVQVITVLVNLTVLALLKYLNLFTQSLNTVFSLLNVGIALPKFQILAPLGLSYYTFNCIGYLIDIGRGKLKAETSLGRFALFVSFFPSILQGPLNRYSDLGAQLRQTHDFSYENLKFGAQLMLWGFFKKLVIADRMAIIANTVFAWGYSGYTGSHVFFGVLAYSFQIYGDFSGGVDIIRGISQMFGIILPLNFNCPFFATSMADFWRRWHMSLGAWMREYVFYPVMLSKPVTAVSKLFRKKFGNYAGKIVPSVAAPMVVFFLIGIWHNINTQYIVNGMYNALLISGSVAFAPVFKKMTEKLHINTEAFSFRLFQILRTFFLLCISRIIVKSPGFTVALRMIRALFTSWDPIFLTGLDGKIFEYGVSGREMLLLFLCLLVLLVVGILQERGVKIRETLAKQGIVFRWGLMLLLLFTVLIFGMYGPGYDAASFIYGRY